MYDYYTRLDFEGVTRFGYKKKLKLNKEPEIGTLRREIETLLTSML